MVLEINNLKKHQPCVEKKVDSTRDVIFLSHANPEENEFTTWLATQLANAGYSVWSDVTKLLGGEKFWDDITKIIEQKTVKFVFISTEISNSKSGTMRELNIALDTENRYKLKNFIIPLKIDGFGYEEANENLHDRNFVKFHVNWGEGLHKLLELLEREKVLKSNSDCSSSVKNWYHSKIDDNSKAIYSIDEYVSNWFKINLPKYVFFYDCSNSKIILEKIEKKLLYPLVKHEKYIITFAEAHDIQDCVELRAINDVRKIETDVFVNIGFDELLIKRFDAKNITINLINQAWEAKIRSFGLHHFELANKKNCWFLTGVEPIKKESMKLGNGQLIRRQLIGRRTKKTSEEQQESYYWHYAISVTPKFEPFYHMAVRHHVIFTDDGAKPWDKSGKMHKARRSTCKEWWNDQWRDRLLIFCNFIAEGNEKIQIPVSRKEFVMMNSFPEKYNSTWSYYENGEIYPNDGQISEEFNEEDCELNNEISE